MSLRGRELTLAPDVLGCARRLAKQPGAFALWTAGGAGPSYVGAFPVATEEGLDPEPTLSLKATAHEFGAVPRWVGVLPYESRRELERADWVPGPDRRPEPRFTRPHWRRYPAVARVDQRVTVIGDDDSAIDRLSVALQQGAELRQGDIELSPVTAEGPERHAARVAAALEKIRAGDLYQVNLSRRLRFHLKGESLDLLELLGARTRAPYAAWLAGPGMEVISCSPELFLQLHPDGRIWTRPIKGTRPRGSDVDGDRALRRQLDADPKERAELAMILDVERNDLARVCCPGSVRLLDGPKTELCGRVWHRSALLQGRLRPGLGRADMLAAMLPSGSVTGAPKVRAMEVIFELEAERRGLYTGALGMVSHDGGMQLSMAIRTLVRQGSELEYDVGGGIVVGSHPELEVEETLWKASQLQELLVRFRPNVH